jgi:pimeloyl-ACP methyl ester carboxylesterase
MIKLHKTVFSATYHTLIVLLLLSSCNSTSKITSLKPTFNENSKTLFIEVNGTKIHYQKSGQGSPLVLMHHVRGQLEYFNEIIPELAKKHTVYAVDLPGHGKSEIKKVDYTAQYSTETMKAFLLELNLEKAYLVGESIGGSLALALCSDQELDIKKAIAFNPFDGKHGIGEGNFIANKYMKALKSKRIGPKVAKIQKKFIFKKVLKGGLHKGRNLDESLVELYLTTGEKEGYDAAFRNFILNNESYRQLISSFSKINVPVMIVRGESDWMPENLRESFGNDIKNVQRKTIQEAGHFSVQEKPKEFIKIINDFINE